MLVDLMRDEPVSGSESDDRDAEGRPEDRAVRRARHPAEARWPARDLADGRGHGPHERLAPFDPRPEPEAVDRRPLDCRPGATRHPALAGGVDLPRDGVPLRSRPQADVEREPPARRDHVPLPDPPPRSLEDRGSDSRWTQIAAPGAQAP